MRDFFEHTSAGWVRYSAYEWRKTADGSFLLMPAKDAAPKPYDPMKEADELVLDAAEIGMMLFRQEPEETVRNAMRDFACKYGLLGIMTALPTTANFIDYEKVYFPKNDLIKAETMETKDYLRLFFPFQMPDFAKTGVESLWSVGDNAMTALAMTYQEGPQAMVMSFLRDYGERYEWLASVFKDWTFTLITTMLFYDADNPPDEEMRDLYRKGMAAFEGNAPTYHLELRDKPTLVWDFHSLLLNIKLLFSLMLTDESNPLRLCRQCAKPFVAKQTNSHFCSTACREKHRNKRQ